MRNGVGIEGLLDVIIEFIISKDQYHRLNLPAAAGKLRADLFNMGVVRNEEYGEDGGWIMEVDMEPHRLDQLFRESGLELSQASGQELSMESGVEDVLLQ